VNIILGGDSFFHKIKDLEINSPLREGSPRRCSLVRVRPDGDSTRDPWTRLDNFILFFVYTMCCCFFNMNDTLFKSFSMHLYIISYMVYWIWVRSYCV
jgi:hypothetical protein